LSLESKLEHISAELNRDSHGGLGGRNLH